MILKHATSKLDWQPQTDKYTFMSLLKRSANSFTARLLQHVFGFGLRVRVRVSAKCVLLVKNTFF